METLELRYTGVKLIGSSVQVATNHKFWLTTLVRSIAVHRGNAKDDRVNGEGRVPLDDQRVRAALPSIEEDDCTDYVLDLDCLKKEPDLFI